MALPGLVIAVAMIGDTLLYAVLPLYHNDFGLSLAMVGVLLSLSRWIRLFPAYEKRPAKEPSGFLVPEQQKPGMTKNIAEAGRI